MDTEELLSGLTAAQRCAVVTEGAPLCILAGAGAGKTRVLTRRMAYRITTGLADADHTLALTFTRKAAGELAERLLTLGVRDRLTTGTFHGVAYAQLRQYWADRGQAAPELLDRKVRLLARLVVGRPHLADAPLRELAGEIEWAQASLIRPEDYAATVAAAQRRISVPADAMAALYARYQTEKQRRRLADFDDLLLHCADAMDHDPAFAAVQRWRWRHLFVDEFQDVTPLQHRLLSGWLADRTDLCVVGDANQAIYGWNGSDPSLLGTVATRWPSAEVVRLDDNHRCSPQVVAAAAAVLGRSGGELRSCRPDGPLPAVRCYPTDRAETIGVVSEMRQARAGGLTWSDLALLVRTNAQIAAFEAALRDARVPYRVAGARALMDHPDVQAELARLVTRPSTPIAMVVADLADRAAAAIPPGEADEPNSGSPTPAATALASLAGAARELQALDRQATAGGFVAWLGPATIGDRVDEPAGGDRVTVCTFHRAKGLEWRAVWVTGLEDGLVPIAHAATPAAEDEERRLLYVALTRAERDLHCSWAEQRTFGTRPVPRRPSRWLSALADGGPTNGPAPAPVPPRPVRDQLAAQRDRLAACRRPGSGRATGAAQPEPAVVDALRAWRAGAARAAGVPGHVLLHDATLAALAAARPLTPEQLLAVPGLGPVKVARYGAVLLDLVAEHLATA